MKLLYVCATASSDGSKIHADSFVEAFRALGNEVIVDRIQVFPFLGDKSTWSLLKKIILKFRWAGENVSILWRVWRLAMAEKPDALLFRYLANNKMSLTLTVLSYLYPIVLEINAVRSIEDPGAANHIGNALDRLAIRRAGQCFVISSRVKDHLVQHLGADEKKIHVVENGVNTAKFNANISGDEAKRVLGLEGRFVIGFVGSFRPWHGVENLIPLMQQLTARYPDITLLAVGDAPERAGYEQKFAEADLSQYVVFTGHVNHDAVPQYIAAMDVAMSPHKKDCFKESGGFHGSPLKLFEYMAMEKAIIAAPLGQIAELIQDGSTGRQLYAEDTEALRDEVIRMYKDRAYRERLGRNARELVEKKYTWEENARKIEKLCRLAMS